MDAHLKIKQFDLMKEFANIILNEYQVEYNVAIRIANDCIRKGYSLKYLKEGIYQKSIQKLIDKQNTFLPSVPVEEVKKSL